MAEWSFLTNHARALLCIAHDPGVRIINIQTSERNGKVVGIAYVHDDDELMLISQQGKILRMVSSGIRAIGRATQGVRLIDIAAALGITERSAYAIVNDLSTAGYVIKEKDGRRNRYEVQGHLPLPGPAIRSTTVGEVLAVLVGDSGAVAPVARRKSPNVA